jgi:hypothetical protein
MNTFWFSIYRLSDTCVEAEVERNGDITQVGLFENLGQAFEAIHRMTLGWLTDPR